MIVDIDEAKTRLSELVDQAANGEPVVIAKGGTPLVKMTAMDAPSKRRFGGMEGQMRIPEDFNRMHEEEIIRLFEGEDT